MLAPAPPLPPVRLTGRRWSTPRTAVLAAGAAGCLAVGLLDPATAPFPACPWRALTGVDCPGCGSTRALHALLRGDVVTAADHNLLLVVALAALAVLGARHLVRRRRDPSASGAPLVQPQLQPALALAVGAVVLGFWAARVAGSGPLAWLASGAGS